MFKRLVYSLAARLWRARRFALAIGERVKAAPFSIIAIVLAWNLGPLASAGYYSTFDAPEETRWSRDYENVFSDVLNNLRAISALKVERDPPIRRRYVLMEALGRAGTPKLGTLEQKLNYSAVLIRRGRADEAMAFLLPLTKEYPDYFIVLSQYATARFLSNNPDFTPEAPEYMKQALEAWPQRWDQVEGDQKKFLESIGWEETAFERFRRYETYLERLMRNRVREEVKRKKNVKVEDAVDPIFLDAQKKPIRFLDEKGEYQAGRIAPANQEELPKDSVEAVEQLLIWMPNDHRLWWLLGEVFNASAMEHKEQNAKNEAINSAFTIFTRMTDPRNPNPDYGLKEIKGRYEVLGTYLEKVPRRIIEIPELPEVTMASKQWWRVTSVGFITGLAVGIFALWQVQEMRRRRQARAAAKR